MGSRHESYERAVERFTRTYDFDRDLEDSRRRAKENPPPVREDEEREGPEWRAPRPYMTEQWWVELRSLPEGDPVGWREFWQEFWTNVRHRGIEKRAEEVAEILEHPPGQTGWLEWLVASGKLTPAQSQALVLTHCYGLTQREAASALGISRETYRDRLKAAEWDAVDIFEAAANGRLSKVRRGANKGRAKMTYPSGGEQPQG